MEHDALVTVMVVFVALMDVAMVTLFVAGTVYVRRRRRELAEAIAEADRAIQTEVDRLVDFWLRRQVAEQADAELARLDAGDWDTWYGLTAPEGADR
jgi:hypothetical protein